jgi:hypothetical protein
LAQEDKDIIAFIHRVSAPLVSSTTRKNNSITSKQLNNLADIVIFHGHRGLAAKTKVVLT